MRTSSNQKMVTYDTVDSPLGTIIIAVEDGQLTELHLADDRYFTQVPAGWQRQPSNAVIQQTTRELAEYFAGRRSRFSVPLAPKGTPFQQSVWAALQNVPFGQTLTYSAIAAAIGKPLAVRAVGSAIGRNPVCIIVPCHRVIASDGSLRGYVAGASVKRTLLEVEGAV